MTLRPGRNLVGLSVAAVVLSAVAFYLPWAIWLLVPLVIAALGCGVYDAALAAAAPLGSRRLPRGSADRWSRRSVRRNAPLCESRFGPSARQHS